MREIRTAAAAFLSWIPGAWTTSTNPKSAEAESKAAINALYAGPLIPETRRIRKDPGWQMRALEEQRAQQAQSYNTSRERSPSRGKSPYRGDDSNRTENRGRSPYRGGRSRSRSLHRGAVDRDHQRRSSTPGRSTKGYRGDGSPDRRSRSRSGGRDRRRTTLDGNRRETGYHDRWGKDYSRGRTAVNPDKRKPDAIYCSGCGATHRGGKPGCKRTWHPNWNRSDEPWHSTKKHGHLRLNP